MNCIEVQHLSKKYELSEANQGEGQSFREFFGGFFSSPTKEFYALDKVSFEVEEGQVLGIIGKNGSGKSTLLKILSGIIAPTSGKALVRGRIASLLEVGTGFHGDLTGRENIFLSGVILGMSQREVRKYLDEIIDYAGIESFVDVPVKKYSSGMRLRLAFSVAAHLNVDILLIDEVLAVGDDLFRKKCLRSIDGLKKEGKTILFTSHDLSTVRSLCTYGLWLQHGRVQSQGLIKDVADSYEHQYLFLQDVALMQKSL